MSNLYITLVDGVKTLIKAISTSAGVPDANQIVSTDATGRIHSSLLPPGIGDSSVTAEASEALDAGDFVELWDDAGVIKARLADNTNNRPAHGFVKTAAGLAEVATVLRLGEENDQISGLVVGTDYFLGTAGAARTWAQIQAAPFASGHLIQFLGKASDDTVLPTATEQVIRWDAA